MTTVKELIEQLELAPHPEGGWYRETWRSDAMMDGGDRASATAIYFLLESHQQSAWHRVDATEIWFWHAGDPLTLSITKELGSAQQDILLGPDIPAGQHAQGIVPAHHWQAATPVKDGAAGYTLVSCVVSPGFEFSGFELADAK